MPSLVPEAAADRVCAMGTNQIIGVCRFSFLGDGFQAAGGDRDAQAARLYDPARLDRRFALFETLVLPSLAEQTDRDFTLAVLTGHSLPAPHRARLDALAARHPFLRVHAMAPAGPLVTTNRALDHETRPDAEFVTGFRIDDDDAVAVDYVARTRHAADGLVAAGMVDAQQPAVVAFHRGLDWDLSDGVVWETREHSPPAVAIAMVRPAGPMRLNIFRWNHRNLAAKARLWSDPTEIMFLRTLHGTNDSGRKRPERSEPLPWDAVAPILSGRFGIDPDRAAALI